MVCHYKLSFAGEGKQRRAERIFTSCLAQSGISLIELLISLLLLSLSLLGLDAMQLYAYQGVKSVLYLTVAKQQLNVIRERITANPANVYEALHTWNEQNKALLPQGRGIMYGSYPQSQIAVFWGKEKDNESCQIKVGQSGCLKING